MLLQDFADPITTLGTLLAAMVGVPRMTPLKLELVVPLAAEDTETANVVGALSDVDAEEKGLWS